MTPEVLVALVTTAGVIVGFFLRPVGDYLGETMRARREVGIRREKYQYDSLIELQAQLEVLMAASTFDPATTQRAQARIESLMFVVRDDRLRELLERLESHQDRSASWRADYGNAIRRLGEVLRSM